MLALPNPVRILSRSRSARRANTLSSRRWPRTLTARPLTARASALLLLLTLSAFGSEPGSLRIHTIPLAPLRISGQPAHAHTQGVELIGGSFYVTARREDGPKKTALLLRTKAGSAGWDSWDLTPLDPGGKTGSLDHPGGLQSDGHRLWIPISESRRQGRSVIRVFPLSGITPNHPLKVELEIPVNDHIGAIAVDRRQRQVYGANWDTEFVYSWDDVGTQQRILSGAEMESRQLGRVKGTPARDGLRVQDWKAVGNCLFASGLLREPTAPPELPESRFTCFERFATSGVQRWSTVLPKHHGIELANEAMAVAGRMVYFLPEDLGESNRVFRISLADLDRHRMRPLRERPMSASK